MLRTLKGGPHPPDFLICCRARQTTQNLKFFSICRFSARDIELAKCVFPWEPRRNEKVSWKNLAENSTQGQHRRNKVLEQKRCAVISCVPWRSLISEFLLHNGWKYENMKNENAQNHISLFTRKFLTISKNRGTSRYATDDGASFLFLHFPSPMLPLSAIFGKKISTFLPVCARALRENGFWKFVIAQKKSTEWNKSIFYHGFCNLLKKPRGGDPPLKTIPLPLPPPHALFHHYPHPLSYCVRPSIFRWSQDVCWVSEDVHQPSGSLGGGANEASDFEKIFVDAEFFYRYLSSAFSHFHGWVSFFDEFWLF